MEAADAFTVIPRSLSTLRVSKSVISSLISLRFEDCIVECSSFVIADSSSFMQTVELSINSSAVDCRSCPKFPVYSNNLEAKLDLP